MNNEKYRNVEDAQRAYRRLQSRIEEGAQDQAAIIEKVNSMVIHDKLVRPNEMVFNANSATELTIEYTRQPGKQYRIHPHAFNQLASKDRVKIPADWANRQLNGDQWRADMLAFVFTETYKKTDFTSKREDNPRFLHRIVGDQLRGFVSRRFNRHIASGRLMSSFLEACMNVGAVPVGATATDIKVALKCALPAIFEVVKGEFVAFGVEWGNSDFGAGRMQVSLCMWSVSGDRFTVLEHSMFRRHLGSVIEESDVEISEETARKEAEAQASAIRDTVVEQLSDENIDKILKVIELAHEEQIPWDKIKGQLSKVVSQEGLKTLKEALENEIIDLPPVKVIDNEKVPTKWWATQALSWLAARTSDPEKRLDLEKASSMFLEVKNA